MPIRFYLIRSAHNFFTYLFIGSLLLMVPQVQAADKVEGGFLQLGPATAVDLHVDQPSFLDWGPGAQVSVGYLSGLFGVRGTFLFADMELRNNHAIDYQLYNGGVDFMLFPLNHQDMFFQPYLFVGPGYYQLRSEDLGGKNNQGPGGNMGIGVNLHLIDHVALSLENSFRPVLFCKNGCDDSHDMYFYSATASIGFFF